MPEELASNASETIFHYKGGISAPKDFVAWGKFIGQVSKPFMDHNLPIPRLLKAWLTVMD